MLSIVIGIRWRGIFIGPVFAKRSVYPLLVSTQARPKRHRAAVVVGRLRGPVAQNSDRLLIEFSPIRDQNTVMGS